MDEYYIRRVIWRDLECRVPGVMFMIMKLQLRKKAEED
jgi:hypothetical protein